MEAQNNKHTLTKPNDFVTSLQKNSTATIARYSRYTPTTIETVINWHQQCQSKIDSLERSHQFFTNQFAGNEADKTNYLAQIEKELATIKAELNQNPTPQPIGRLYSTNPTQCQIGIKLLINDLRLFFQADNMISTDNINTLCPLIIGEYPGLSLEEITVCFAQAKKGYYGPIYNRLDGAIILNWLRQYHTDKTERLIQQQHNQHHQSKADIGHRPKPTSPTEALQIAQAAVALDKAKK